MIFLVYIYISNSTMSLKECKKSFTDGCILAQGSFGAVVYKICSNNEICDTYQIEKYVEKIPKTGSLTSWQKSEITKEFSFLHLLSDKDNSYVVKGYDLDRNTYTIKQEFLSGPTLMDFRHKNKKRFGSRHFVYEKLWNHAPHIIRQLLVGLNYIHSKKVLHLDIRDENIIIDTSMTPCRPVFIDFGFSESFNSDFEWCRFEKTPADYRGTQEYMLKLFGKEKGSRMDTWTHNLSSLKTTCYSELNDIFAIGVVIQELLCSFEKIGGQGENQDNIYNAAVTGDFMSIFKAAIPVEYHDLFDEIFPKLTSKQSIQLLDDARPHAVRVRDLDTLLNNNTIKEIIEKFKQLAQAIKVNDKSEDKDYSITNEGSSYVPSGLPEDISVYSKSGVLRGISTGIATGVSHFPGLEAVGTKMKQKMQVGSRFEYKYSDLIASTSNYHLMQDLSFIAKKKKVLYLVMIKSVYF